MRHTDLKTSEQYKTPHNLDARIGIHQHFGTNPEPIFRWAWEHYPLRDGLRVVEAGCGTGEFWKQNEERIPPGLKAELTDFSEGMVERARVTIGGRTCFRIQSAPADALPFESESFDAAIAHFMLYHTPSRERALAEISRVLKPEGFLGVVTNSLVHMREIFDLAYRLAPEIPRDRTVEPFCEKNADLQLATAFARVEKHVWEDVLRVTEVEAAVAYIRSCEPYQKCEPGFFEAYGKEVKRQIAENGAFLVHKRCALYVCRK